MNESSCPDNLCSNNGGVTQSGAVFGWNTRGAAAGCSHSLAPASSLTTPRRALLAPLLDPRVRLKEEGGRYRPAKLLGRFHVDRQLKLSWLLHGQVRGLGAFEDLVHVCRSTAVHVQKARAVG